jgi:hypothetical protein
VSSGEFILRYLALILAAALFAGCANDIVLKDPRSGASVACAQSLGGLDPWSQTYACAARHAAQGWRVVSGP